MNDDINFNWNKYSTVTASQWKVEKFKDPEYEVFKEIYYTKHEDGSESVDEIYYYKYSMEIFINEQELSNYVRSKPSN